MKVAVAACLHGNLAAFEAVYEDAKRRGADKVVVAGDLLGGHPDHQALIARLRELRLDAVSGILDVSFDDLDQVRAMGDNPFSRAFLWAAERLTEDEKGWLCSLPIGHSEFGGTDSPLLVVHNSPRSRSEKMDWPTAFDAEDYGALFRGGMAGVIARANLHGQFAVARGSYLSVNVGSAGLPVDGDPRAAYALFESAKSGWRFEFLRASYDTEAAARRIFDSEMPDGEARAELTRTGKRTW